MIVLVVLASLVVDRVLLFLKTTLKTMFLCNWTNEHYTLLAGDKEAEPYPDGYFNDRLVQVIDHLLATPEVVDPIELVRPHVLYEYSDPDLEALSSGQKLLLRMGTDNGKKIKNTLRKLRGLVTTM